MGQSRNNAERSGLTARDIWWILTDVNLLRVLCDHSRRGYRGIHKLLLFTWQQLAVSQECLSGMVAKNAGLITELIPTLGEATLAVAWSLHRDSMLAYSGASIYARPGQGIFHNAADRGGG